MKEVTRGKRGWLYGMAGALIATILLAGVVFKPRESVKDLEKTLAIYMQAEIYDKAREVIDQIQDRDPKNLYATLIQAYLHTNANEPEQAYCLYRNALTFCDSHPELEGRIMDSASMLALKAGRYEEARNHAERKISQFGENVTSRLIIALSLFCLNDDKSFEEHLNRAVEMGIEDPGFRMKLDTLLGDREILERLYIQSLLDRARYEQSISDYIWM